MLDATHFSATIYQSGEKKTSCKIWFGSNMGLPTGLFYSSNETANDNSFNESLSVTDNGYSLILKPLGMALLGQSRDGQLSM